jgi:hypothetical protein
LSVVWRTAGADGFSSVPAEPTTSAAPAPPIPTCDVSPIATPS